MVDWMLSVYGFFGYRALVMERPIRKYYGNRFGVSDRLMYGIANKMGKDGENRKAPLHQAFGFVLLLPIS